MTDDLAQKAAFFGAMDTDELAAIWKANDRGAWSDEAFVVIGQILRERGRTPEPQDVPRTLSIREATRPRRFSPTALWRGEMSLGETFWGYLVGARVVMLLLITAVAILLLAADSGAAITVSAVAVMLAFVGLIYTPFIWIATWRSASAYQGPRFLARRAKMEIVGEIIAGAGLSIIALLNIPK